MEARREVILFTSIDAMVLTTNMSDVVWYEVVITTISGAGAVWFKEWAARRELRTSAMTSSLQ